MRQSTEGKINLPRLLSMALSCLGAIKGTPRCMEEDTKHSYNIPRLLSMALSCLGAIKGTPRCMEEDTKHSYNIPKHQDLDSAHLFHCDSI